MIGYTITPSDMLVTGNVELKFGMVGTRVGGVTVLDDIGAGAVVDVMLIPMGPVMAVTEDALLEGSGDLGEKRFA